MRPIAEVASELGLDAAHVVPWGRQRAKIELTALENRTRKGKLVLVSAISPTDGGEGKTTISVALAMGLRRLGRRAIVCLRQPSMGPVFGIKGGGTGGGEAQVEPAEDINLHFTGDLHAIGAAHNLLAALVDNDLHFGEKSGLDVRKVSFPRVLDVEDRALRHVVLGLGGELHGVPRETRFDITAASEVMACLCLSTSHADLHERLGRIVLGERADDSEVRAGDVGGVGALDALLRDALLPNLVQTREGGPALVHGGPFANIAHGCSSAIATELALAYADDVVTEAGFGFDLGGEKFLHIKSRQQGLTPHCVVLVCTLKALRTHGQGDLVRGLSHLDRHLENVRRFGLIPLVAINEFSGDSAAELQLIRAHCITREVRVAGCQGFLRGGEGALDLAREVAGALSEPAPSLRFLYPLEASLADKVRTVARELYGARDVIWAPHAEHERARAESQGHGALPVCIAKTPNSFSDDPHGGGLIRDHELRVTSLRVCAGAGFVVALMGDINTMPGLPKSPAALRVSVDAGGRIHGLMQNDG